MTPEFEAHHGRPVDLKVASWFYWPGDAIPAYDNVGKSRKTILHELTNIWELNLVESNYSQGVDGCGSTKVQVIVAEDFCVLALIKLLIMPDHVISSRKFFKCPLSITATEVGSVGIEQWQMCQSWHRQQGLARWVYSESSSRPLQAGESMSQCPKRQLNFDLCSMCMGLTYGFGSPTKKKIPEKKKKREKAEK